MTDHNHLTRDVKARGKCPACDEHWARYALSLMPSVADAVDAAFELLEELALPPAAQSPAEILRKRGDLLDALANALAPVSHLRTSRMVGT